MSAGCGDNNLCPTEITVHISGTPALYAFRDGDKEWSIRTAAARDKICVSDSYKVLLVCEWDNGDVLVWQKAATTADMMVTGPDCVHKEMTSVSATVSQQSTVWLNRQEYYSQEEHWRLSARVPPENVDVVHTSGASSSAKLVSFRRGVEIGLEPHDLGVLDLTSEGISANPIDVEISGNIPQSGLASAVYFNGYDPYETTRWPRLTYSAASTPYVLPSASLHVDESQQILLGASIPTPEGFKQVTSSREFSFGKVRDFVIPDQINGLRYTSGPTLRVTWDDLPISDYDGVAVGSGNVSERLSIHTMIATREWIEQNSRQELSLDLSIPEFLDKWQLDFSQDISAAFIVVDEFDDGFDRSSISGLIRFGTPAQTVSPCQSGISSVGRMFCSEL
jgi:hypothetical protein